MATITTKYSVGDTVYSAGTTTIRKQRPCPDCKGSKLWKAVSPAGTEYEFACPRCAAGYHSNDDISLAYSAHVPSVQMLTIGQVQVRTEPDPEIRYMCRETGIGSGTLWNETDLHPTHQEATAASEVLAKTRDQTTGWIAKQYDKSLRVCDYELHHAVKKAADDAETSRQVRYQMLFEDLRDCQTNAEVHDALERYSQRIKELAA